MSKRDELADLIYRNQYTVPEEPNIRPLAKCPKWEQEAMYRGADAVLEWMDRQ